MVAWTRVTAAAFGVLVAWTTVAAGSTIITPFEVNTAEELQDAVLQNRSHIVITSHIELSIGGVSQISFPICSADFTIWVWFPKGT